MDRFWIRLWRKTEDNEVFLHDPTAWHIFEYLLLKVNKTTGVLDTGRIIIAHNLFIPESTVYDALQRLQKRKMIDIKTHTSYSRITIVKWKLYQSPGNTFGNNRTTTGQHPTRNEKYIYKGVENEKLSTEELEKGYEVVKRTRELAKSKSMDQGSPQQKHLKT